MSGVRTIARVTLVAVLVAVGGSSPSRSVEEDPPASNEPPERRKAEAYYHFTLGSLLANEGRLEGALAQLAEAARLDPGASEILVEMSGLHLRSGELDEALSSARAAVARQPDSPEAHRALGDALSAQTIREGMEAGALIEAILEYRRAVELGASEEETLTRLGRLEMRADMTEEAVSTFRRILADNDTARSHLLLGRALLQAGKPEEALAEFEVVVRRFPSNVEAVGHVASLHERAERWDEAVRAYETLSSLRPSDPALRFRLGVNLLRAGRPAEAIEPLRFAVEGSPTNTAPGRALALALRRSGRPSEALDRYRLLVRSDPDDLYLLTDMASLHRQRGELDEAADLFERALTVAERQAGIEPGGLEIAVDLAAVELRRERPKRALAALERAGKFGGADRGSVALLRCQALIQSGRPELASREATHGRVRFPDDVRFRLMEAEAALARGDERATELDLSAALEQSGGDPDVLYLAADMWSRNGREDRAIDTLQRLAQDRPDDDRVWFEVGGALERAGRVEEAVHALNRSIQLNGGNHLALNYLGYMLAERGERLEEAQEMIERALDLAPNNGAYLDSLGWVLYRRGLVSEAFEPMSRAADLLAGDSTVREHMGDVLAAMGRWNEAKEEWRRARELGGSDERLAEKIRKATRKKQLR